MPNVRAKREPTVARQARAVENATAPRTGPGGLPLALRLTEGLGSNVEHGAAAWGGDRVILPCARSAATKFLCKVFLNIA